MRTRIMLLSAASGLALLLPAHADLSGYAELGGGIGAAATSFGYVCNPPSACNPSHDAQTPVNYFGGVHLAVPVLQDLRLHFDAQGASTSFNGRFGMTPADDEISRYGAAAHAIFGDVLRTGVFVSVGEFDWKKTVRFEGTTHKTSLDNPFVSAGMEGEWSLGRMTPFTQLSYSQEAGGDVDGLRSGFLRAGVRYFPFDNLKLEASGGGGVFETDLMSGHGPGSWRHRGAILSWAAKGEYRLTQLPLGFALTYSGSSGSWTRDYYQTLYDPIHEAALGIDFAHLTNRWHKVDHAVMLSIRFHFGSDTLIDADRAGTNMTDRNPWYGEDAPLPPVQQEAFTSVPSIAR